MAHTVEIDGLPVYLLKTVIFHGELLVITRGYFWIFLVRGCGCSSHPKTRPLRYLRHPAVKLTGCERAGLQLSHPSGFQGQGTVCFPWQPWLVLACEHILFNNLIWHGEIRDCNKPERITPLKRIFR